jgi:3-oxoadipate enol-lactonase
MKNAFQNTWLTRIVLGSIIVASPSASAAGSVAHVNGTTLYYEIKGRGFPVVFVSGGGILDRRCWDYQFETFARHYRVMRYDVRGIGRSARPNGPFSHSQDLYALMTSLRITRAHIVALSVGGAIAIDFALEHAEMVDHLVLAAPGLSDDAKADANMEALSPLTTTARRDGIDRVIDMTLDAPFVITKSNAEARNKIRRIYRDNRDVFESEFPIYKLWQPTRPAASRRLAAIHTPVLIIRGDNDHPSYKAMTDRIATGIRATRTEIIEGGTHFINLDKPDAFNRAALAFLRGRAP